MCCGYRFESALTVGWKIAATHALLSLSIIAAPLMGTAGVQAAVVTLTASDAMNTSSFNSAGHWSDGLPPSIANDYVVTGLTLRTPWWVPNVTFGGRSLTINGGGMLLFKGDDGYLVAISNLVLDNGTVGNGAGDGPTFTLAGSVVLGNGNGILDMRRRVPGK